MSGLSFIVKKKSKWYVQWQSGGIFLKRFYVLNQKRNSRQMHHQRCGAGYCSAAGVKSWQRWIPAGTDGVNKSQAVPKYFIWNNFQVFYSALSESSYRLLYLWVSSSLTSRIWTNGISHDYTSPVSLISFYFIYVYFIVVTFDMGEVSLELCIC